MSTQGIQGSGVSSEGMNEICHHCGAPATTNGATGQPRCCDQCDNRPMSCDCADRARTTLSEENTKSPVQQGAATIGNGLKLHPAAMVTSTGFDGKPYMSLYFQCGCPGTNSGSARKKAMFYAGRQGNCRS